MTDKKQKSGILADSSLAPWHTSAGGGTLNFEVLDPQEKRRASAHQMQVVQCCPPPTDPNGRTRVNEVVGTRITEPVRSGDTQKVPVIKESWYQANRRAIRLYALVLGSAVLIGIALGMLIHYFR